MVELGDSVGTFRRWLQATRRVLEWGPGSPFAELTGGVEQALQKADSPEEYGRVREELVTFAAQVEEWRGKVGSWLEQADRLEAEWLERERFTDRGWAYVRASVVREFELAPIRGARKWLSEVIAALDANEIAAAKRVAAEPFSFPSQLEEGMAFVRAGVMDLGDGPLEGLDFLNALADGDAPGWHKYLPTSLRSKVHIICARRIAAAYGDAEEARAHLDAAVSLDKTSGSPYAERAAYELLAGDTDSAIGDAQRAVELGPQDPAGYLALGAASEITGQWPEVDDAYSVALDLMTPLAHARLGRTDTFFSATGRLMYRAAENLADANHDQAALELLDRALFHGVHGEEQYPEAGAYALRSEVRLRVGDRTGGAADARTGAAADALEAGRRYVWMNQYEAAVDALQRAQELDPSLEESGWLLVELHLQLASADGDPDRTEMEEVLRLWDAQFRQFGAPTGPLSWAYVTKGVAETNIDPWAAMTSALRALVHQEDGDRWALLAQQLDGVNRDLLAEEAIELAFVLDPENKFVLNQRITIHANLGRLDQAEDAARRLLRQGADPWLHAVLAWIELRRANYDEVLRWLAFPLSEASWNDLWVRDLASMAYLGNDDPDAARKSLISALEFPPRSASDRLTLIVAKALQGHAEDAEEDWRDVLQEADMGAAPWWDTGAALAAIRHEWQEAKERALHAVEEATPRELTDLLSTATSQLRLVTEGDVEGEQHATEINLEVVATAQARLESLDKLPPTADDEFAELKSDVLEEPGRTAVDALAARRAEIARDLDEAADLYERLIESERFSPEAVLALQNVLEEDTAVAVGRGDVAAVDRAQSRLMSLGLVDSVAKAVAIARATDVGGDPDEAIARLETEISSLDDSSGRMVLIRLLGDIALGNGDEETAASSYTSAVGLARDIRDQTAIAELAARLSVTAVRDGPDSVIEWLKVGLDAWRNLDIWSPALQVARDVQQITEERLTQGGADVVASIAKIAKLSVGTESLQAELLEEEDYEMLRLAGVLEGGV